MTDIGTHWFGDDCPGGHMDEACVSACGEHSRDADTTTGDTDGDA